MFKMNENLLRDLRGFVSGLVLSSNDGERIPKKHINLNCMILSLNFRIIFFFNYRKILQ